MHRDYSSWAHLWESGNYVLLLSDPSVEQALTYCLIYDATNHSIVRIEDDELYTELKRRMYEAGVPIVQDRPPGENIVEAILRMVNECGTHSISLNQLLKEAKRMEGAGKSREAITSRIKELIDQAGR